MAKGKPSGFNNSPKLSNKKIKDMRSARPEEENVQRTQGRGLVGTALAIGGKWVAGKVIKAATPVAMRAASDAVEFGENAVRRGAEALVDRVKTVGSRGNSSGGPSNSRTGLAVSGSAGASDGGSRASIGLNNRGIDIDLTRNSATTLGFGVSKINNSPLVFNSQAETAYYENPNRTQAAVTDNSPNYSRTCLKTIGFDLFNGTDSDQIVNSIYTSYQQEILSNTNGGNSGISTIFTAANFKLYLQSVYYLFMVYTELTTLMAWSGNGPIPNKVLRKIAGQFTGVSDLLILRNRISTILQAYVLPVPLVEYGQWLLQTYRSNDHSYSIDQKFVSPDMMKFLQSNTTSTYVNSINALINAIALQTNFPTISALLISKTSGNWRWLDTFKDPLSCSTFDRSFNDIFNNLAHTTQSNNGLLQCYYPSQLTAASGETAPACFECPIGMLPIHTTEALCHRWEGSNPLCFVSTALPGGSTNFANNTFVGSETTTQLGYAFDPVNIPRNQIGNSIIKIWKNDASGADQPACDYQLAPRGDQVFLFDVSYQQTLLSKTRFAEMMFN